jgi:serine phosphatase RsbU (regulator of sigma subunit)
VKAVNVYGTESEIAEYAFEILPPWYRTTWAYLLYLGLFIGFVWLMVYLNTRRLRHEKIKLEIIVKERTAEIVQQKEEIQTIADNLRDANEEISSKNELLAQKNKHITDSIAYASRIQEALLPPKELLEELLPEHFVLFKPRDIVSGDFYWLKQIGNFTVYAAADCTGHGVPGAFMSMLGISFLNELVTKSRFDSAGELLDRLRKKVKTSLRQTGKEDDTKDGMDIALCVIDNDSMTLQYAGAYNPVYIIRDGELQEIKATRNPIGIYLKEVSFQSNDFSLRKGDVLYTFSDGYIDQFGGEDERKFKARTFKDLLMEIHQKPMQEQEAILDKTIIEWQGKAEQTDDILVFGVRI